ncbi:MAG TPA: NAD(P)H-binding protein [Vicinamibacterales bacterium]|nr:NAD(P)H-binding protein [Vicinamibacterales bacterium]
MAEITITGGTGYIGRALIGRLVGAGHTVTALARTASRHNVSSGARIVEGSALKADDVSRALTDRCTLVLLVGTPHPNPSKARQFNEVDLESVKAAAKAIRRGAVAHVVYVSVAHPAPVMKAYIAVRTEGERLLKETGVPLTVLRPWYVLGPGHWWPLALIPFYKLFEQLPSTRDTALRLGLVTHAQMVSALASAAAGGEPRNFRVIDVPEIRGARSGSKTVAL